MRNARLQARFGWVEPIVVVAWIAGIDFAFQTPCCQNSRIIDANVTTTTATTITTTTSTLEGIHVHIHHGRVERGV